MPVSHCPILTRDGQMNVKFLISREVTPEDGNKIIVKPKASRLLRKATRWLPNHTRGCYGMNCRQRQFMPMLAA